MRIIVCVVIMLSLFGCQNSAKCETENLISFECTTNIPESVISVKYKPIIDYLNFDKGIEYRKIEINKKYYHIIGTEETRDKIIIHIKPTRWADEKYKESGR